MEKEMKKSVKKLNKVFILFILLVIGSNMSYGRYYKSIQGKYEGIIAEPIIKIQRISQKVVEDNYMKSTQGLEYVFDVVNYSVDELGNKKISEVDFCYIITLKETNNNFPVRFELYDMSTGEELLQGRSCSLQMNIKKGIEYTKRYKLIAIWDDNKELNGSVDDVDIEVEIIQCKKGVLA